MSSNAETSGAVMHNNLNTGGMTLVYFWASNTNEMRMYQVNDDAAWVQQSITGEAMDFYISGTVAVQ